MVLYPLLNYGFQLSRGHNFMVCGTWLKTGTDLP